MTRGNTTNQRLRSTRSGPVANPARLSSMAPPRLVVSPRLAVPPRRDGRGGFTLLEVVLALSLMIAMMAGIYEFYTSTMRARDAAVRSMRDTIMMRAMLEQMAEDIRHMTDFAPDGQVMIGDQEQLTFVRMGLPDMGLALQQRDPITDDPKPGLQDLYRITYMLQRDTEEEYLDEDGTPVVYGLLRTRPQLIDPNSTYTMSPEALAKYEEETGFELEMGEPAEPPPPDLMPEIKYLRFWYYDGTEWLPRWQVAAPPEEQLPGEEGTGEEGWGDDGSGSGDGSGGGLDGGLGDEVDEAALAEGALLALSGPSPEEGGQVALPQAIQIIIGKTKVPRDEDEFDISRVAEENEIDNETYHPDRWSIRVYLRQTDQSMLGSRGHGQRISGEQETSTHMVGGLR